MSLDYVPKIRSELSFTIYEKITFLTTGPRWFNEYYKRLEHFFSHDIYRRRGQNQNCVLSRRDDLAHTVDRCPVEIWIVLAVFHKFFLLEVKFDFFYAKLLFFSSAVIAPICFLHCNHNKKFTTQNLGFLSLEYFYHIIGKNILETKS